MCRTVNGLDVNAINNFKTNIQHVIDGEFDKIDDVFSGVIKDGRGNICPVTIILPTLAMEAVQSIDDDENANGKESIVNAFMELLDILYTNHLL